MAVEAKAEFDERIDAHEGLRKRITDLVGASERATATSEDTMGRCGQTVVQIRNAKKLVEAAHVEAKAPYLEGGRVIDAAKNELVALLGDAQKRIETKQSAYLAAQKKADDERKAKAAAEQRRVDEENARIKREHDEAVRKAEEEAWKLRGTDEAPAVAVDIPPEPVFIAPPKPAPEIERGIIRGAEGAAVSAKMVWKSQVQDYAAAVGQVISNPKVKEAIDAAIAALVRAGIREVPGVRIWEEVGVSNR
ncbi:MAG: hypothetical protein ACRCWJ_03220 [Casimicrobium sp.]